MVVPIEVSAVKLALVLCWQLRSEEELLSTAGRSMHRLTADRETQLPPIAAFSTLHGRIRPSANPLTAFATSAG